MKAVFLDKDGTLIEDVPYNVDPDRIQLTPGAGEALRSLQQAGYRLIIISNQSGVARGYFEESALTGVRHRLEELLQDFGVVLDDFYYCPHHPEGMVEAYAIACNCRKPEAGLILKAANKHSISLQTSWFVGDILNDVEAGKKAGCRTVLIDNGNETEWIVSPQRTPDFKVKNFTEVAEVILSRLKNV